MSLSQLSEDLLTPFGPVKAPMGPILVASDTSPASDATFPMARALAMHTGSAVQVISALRPNAMPTYAFDALPYPIVPTPAMLEGREAMVKQQMARLVPSATPWPVTIRTGDPVREIISQAKASDARLIIMGRGKHGPLERMLGGESVLKLLQLGETPVLAVETHLESLPKRVVIATDFSVFSVYAALVALDLIAPNATVELVHVAPSLNETGPVMRDFAEEYRRQTETSFASLVSRLQRPGMTFETRMLEGNASNRLKEYLVSFGADLIVSATHGYGFLRRMMLGSVTAELVRSAPCSVLCVPGSARTLAAARAQATALHDSTRTFDTEHIDAELFNFSVRNIGRACTVEVNQREYGAQSLGHHLPLVGVAHDAAAGNATLMFGASQLEGEHLSHQVRGVQSVDLVTDQHACDQVLRFVHDGGQTLILLE